MQVIEFKYTFFFNNPVLIGEKNLLFEIKNIYLFSIQMTNISILLKDMKRGKIVFNVSRFKNNYTHNRLFLSNLY